MVWESARRLLAAIRRRRRPTSRPRHVLCAAEAEEELLVWVVVARHGWVAVVHRAGWVEAAELHAVWVAVVCLLASVALVLRRVRVYAVRASADALQLAG